MTLTSLQRRTLALVAVMTPLLLVFLFVAMSSGPLAKVKVTLSTVESQAIAPALFGIGTVQARYTYRIGPVYAGRVQRLDVDVGDAVSAGQVLGEMDAVDLDERIAAQQAAINSSQAAVRQAEAKQVFAQAQAKRYENLRAVGSTSEEQVSTKRQELAIANAALAAAREDTVRLRAELEALQAQRNNLRLVAPVAGLVAARDADPGTTVVAGQAVVEVIDPTSLWVDTRFDQISADGLAPGLSASITLRSRHAQPLPGQVMRVELRADSVTEETLAKVIFNTTPELLPPLGELAEVTVQLGELAETPVIPNAAIRTVEGQRGVWTLTQGELAFVPVTLGRTDLQGRIQVLSGLSAGDQIIVYSEKAIRATSRLQVVERLAGVAP